MRRSPVVRQSVPVVWAAVAALLVGTPPILAAEPQSAAPAAKPAVPAAKPAVPAAKPAVPAAAKTVAAIPPDVRARVVAKLPGASPGDVALSPVPGLYEVTMGGLVAYVSADGKYLVSGNVYDLDSQVNLTAARARTARAKTLAAVSESDMIVFGPANAKMTVTVFTDIDCGYCRKFHSHIADINKAGVRVRYLMYPRTGPGTESWAEAERVWCAADRRNALTLAKQGTAVKSKACGDAAIARQYGLGSDLGVEGTPAIFTQGGDYIGGYLAPAELVQAIKDSQQAAGAGR